MASRLSSLRLLESYLEDLESLVEEINRLEGVDAEANAYELNKSLSKITKFLERNDDGEDYDELIDKYNSVLDQLTVDISEFRYKRNLPIKMEQPSKKSVRFNDTVAFEGTTQVNSSFEPFKDDSDDTMRAELFGDLPQDDEENDLSNTTNKDMFIQHQQQLLQQDEHLGVLAQSVKRQHGLSLDINNELQDQNILLDDLENQLDDSQKNLSRGDRRLEYFTKKAKENGQWLTIIVLIIILVLLLIILK